MAFKYEGLVHGAQAVLTFGLVVVAVYAFRSPASVGWAYLAATAAVLLMLALAARSQLTSLHLTPRWGAIRRLLRIALPLALAGGASSLYMNIDSALLGWWKSMEAVGFYDAADRLIAFSVLPMSLLSLVALPAFSAVPPSDGEFHRRWDTWSTAMVAFASFSTFAILARAEEIIHLIFGYRYEPAVPVLRIMAASALLIYLYMPSYQALVIFDRQMHLFGALAAAVVVNVALNLYLIPHYSLVGAALATVATHGFILLELALLAAICTPVKPLNAPMAGALVACTGAGLAAYAIMKASVFGSLFVSFPLGGLTYVAILFVLLKMTGGDNRGWTFSFSN